MSMHLSFNFIWLPPRTRADGSTCAYLYTLPKVQALGAVALHAAAACTDDASIFGFKSAQLGYSLVSSLVLHVEIAVRINGPLPLAHARRGLI